MTLRRPPPKLLARLSASPWRAPAVGVRRRRGSCPIAASPRGYVGRRMSAGPLDYRRVRRPDDAPGLPEPRPPAGSGVHVAEVQRRPGRGGEDALDIRGPRAPRPQRGFSGSTRFVLVVADPGGSAEVGRVTAWCGPYVHDHGFGPCLVVCRSQGLFLMANMPGPHYGWRQNALHGE
jgi:hypothetical protein